MLIFLHCGSYSDAWAARHFLHPKTLRKAREVRTQLLDIMKHQKLDIIPCGTDWDVIRRTICGAYYHQAARVKGIGEFQHLRTGGQCTCSFHSVPRRHPAHARSNTVPMHLHATSSLYGLGYLPDYVVYHEVSPSACWVKSEPDLNTMRSSYLLARNTCRSSRRSMPTGWQTSAASSSQVRAQLTETFPLVQR